VGVKEGAVAKLQAAVHGNTLMKAGAERLGRWGTLTLTDTCLSFIVKDINLPWRARDVHLPLSEIAECSPFSTLGKNSFRVVTREGKELAFTVYGFIPIDIIPLYQGLRDEWIATIRKYIDAGLESPSCPVTRSQQETNDRNPQVLVFLIWCLLTGEALVGLAIAGTDVAFLLAVFFASLTALLLTLGQIRSG
jgi:hypothetical protein